MEFQGQYYDDEAFLGQTRGVNPGDLTPEQLGPMLAARGVKYDPKAFRQAGINYDQLVAMATGQATPPSWALSGGGSGYMPPTAMQQPAAASQQPTFQSPPAAPTVPQTAVPQAGSVSNSQQSSPVVASPMQRTTRSGYIPARAPSMMPTAYKTGVFNPQPGWNRQPAAAGYQPQRPLMTGGYRLPSNRY